MSEHPLLLTHSLAALEPSQICWGLFSAVVLVIVLSKAAKKHPNYPPGPPRDPIFGNARQMTGEHIELKFTEWGKRYGMSNRFPVEIRAPIYIGRNPRPDMLIGDIIYLQVLGQSLVVLNSYTACKDLLEKRGGIYSSRPRFVLLSEL
jgi:hypothetical protein